MKQGGLSGLLWASRAAQTSAALILLLVTLLQPGVWIDLAEPAVVMVPVRQWLLGIQGEQTCRMDGLAERGSLSDPVGLIYPKANISKALAGQI